MAQGTVDRRVLRSSSTAPAAATKPNATGRITRKLVALSSAAILSVYAIGYARTQTAAELSAGTPSSDTPPVPSTPAPTPTFATPGQPAAVPALAQPTPSSGALMDGTYVGSGTSRHGGIEATVVVASGKVRSVAISQCLTRYPCTWIADLPAEVVARQSAQVDLVSGASDSSRAFIQAVSNALARAR